MINIILITAIVTFIVDISGVIDTIKYVLWKKYVKIGNYKNLQIKPLSCSLCMTFWVGLLYLIFTHKFTVPYIAFVCLCSLLSSKIADIEQYIIDVFTWIINKLYKLIEK